MQPRYNLFPEEYDCKVVNPLDAKLYSVVTGKQVPGDPGNIVDGSGSLHHSIYRDAKGNAWTQGDNTSNISGTRATGITIGLTLIPISNVKQVVAYANGGDPNGLGYGNAILTQAGLLYLTGNTQSGFRGDGTEGFQSELSPYQVASLPGPVDQMAIGSFCFARIGGKVYGWGGTRQPTPAPYMLGQGVNKPVTGKPTLVLFPEDITDIQGGGTILLATGVSGKIYLLTMAARYMCMGAAAQPKTSPTDITAALALPGKVVQLAVGPQACYALLDNGDAYAWGDNTQAAIGNGQEGPTALKTGVAPWGGGELWVDKPVKVNPVGVSFVKIFTSLGLAFYVYYEDTTAALWSNGRNKGYVLWNGQGGTSAQQDATPNKWDVLAVSKIVGFGTIAPAPATCKVTSVTTVLFGQTISLPLSALRITFSDGTTQ